MLRNYTLFFSQTCYVVLYRQNYTFHTYFCSNINHEHPHLWHTSWYSLVRQQFFCGTIFHDYLTFFPRRFYHISSQKKKKQKWLYNLSKWRINVVDKLYIEYTVSRKYKRWPLTILFGLLDVAAFNTLVVFRNNMIPHPPIQRVLLFKHFTLNLIKLHIASRISLQGLPLHIKSKLKRFSGVEA